MPDRPSVEVVTEALEKAPVRKFPESVELSVNLKDLDLSVPKNRLEDDIPLPNGRGTTVKVAVFGTPELLPEGAGGRGPGDHRSPSSRSWLRTRRPPRSSSPRTSTSSLPKRR